MYMYQKRKDLHIARNEQKPKLLGSPTSLAQKKDIHYTTTLEWLDAFATLSSPNSIRVLMSHV